MNKDIEDIEPLNPIYMHPWKCLNVDLCGPFPTGIYIFFVTDAYSRYSEAVLLKNTSSKSLIKELDSIFSRHGYPMTFKTDNSPNLVSVEMENNSHSQGIYHVKLSTDWPRSNREVEPYNWTLLKSIMWFMPKVKIGKVQDLVQDLFLSWYIWQFKVYLKIY